MRPIERFIACSRLTPKRLPRLSNLPLLPVAYQTNNTTCHRNIAIPSNFSIRTLSTTNPTPTTYDVRIVEVGPRDGLQNEPSMIVPVEDKVQLIRLLMNAGCRHIEVGSFVSTKAVPNMANSSQVIQQLSELLRSSSSSASSVRSTTTTTTTNSKDDDHHHPITTTNTNRQVQFSALVPTIRYLQDALKYRDTIDEIAIFASASETFSHKVR